MTFSAYGKYLWTGGKRGVRVWRVEDGKKMTALEAKDTQCLAVSKDDRSGDVRRLCVCVGGKDIRTSLLARGDNHDINGVDFSPDSSRLVSASRNSIAAVWKFATRKQVQMLSHGDAVIAAKYSPQGDRIATATHESVRVWDSNDGRLLVDIPEKVTPCFNTGLLWPNNHLLVVSDGTIKEIEASTGTVSKRQAPGCDSDSCIALPRHGEFIACSTKDIVRFRDTATHTQLGLVQHPQNIRSIAVSPDDRFLAIGGQDGRVTINSLSQCAIASIWIVVNNSFLTPIILP